MIRGQILRRIRSQHLETARDFQATGHPAGLPSASANHSSIPREPIIFKFSSAETPERSPSPEPPPGKNFQLRVRCPHRRPIHGKSAIQFGRPFPSQTPKPQPNPSLTHTRLSNSTPSASSPLPGVTHSGGVPSVTWTKAASYSGAYPTDFLVDPQPAGTVKITGNEGKYIFPSGANNFAHLNVTGP